MPYQLPCALAAAPMAIYKGEKTKCIGSFSEYSDGACETGAQTVTQYNTPLLLFTIPSKVFQSAGLRLLVSSLMPMLETSISLARMILALVTTSGLSPKITKFVAALRIAPWPFSPTFSSLLQLPGILRQYFLRESGLRSQLLPITPPPHLRFV
jgi:hypothetical protein